MHHALALLLEHGSLDLLEFVLELGQIMRVPEACEFRYGVRLWYLAHGVFDLLNRLRSLSVMGRAVTGYPLPSGNWITTQKR